jgi:hypothetical protein
VECYSHKRNSAVVPYEITHVRAYTVKLLNRFLRARPADRSSQEPYSSRFATLAGRQHTPNQRPPLTPVTLRPVLAPDKENVEPNPSPSETELDHAAEVVEAVAAHE